MQPSLFDRVLAYFKKAKDVWGIAVWLVGFVGWTTLVAYLGHITEWAQFAGPLGLFIVAVVTLLIMAAAYWMIAVAAEHRALARYTRAKAQAGHVNPLEKVHTNERIDASQLYHPFFKAIEDARFENCEIFGPANLYMSPWMLAGKSGLHDCEAVIVRTDKPIKGATQILRCHFVNCSFYRITFFMTPDDYRALLKAGIQAAHLAAISDGRAGDL